MAPVAGLARAPRVEVHPKLQGQALPNVLENFMPRLHKNKKLKPDAIQNCENAIADLVSSGTAYAGKAHTPLCLLLPISCSTVGAHIAVSVLQSSANWVCMYTSVKLILSMCI